MVTEAVGAQTGASRRHSVVVRLVTLVEVREDARREVDYL